MYRRRRNGANDEIQMSRIDTIKEYLAEILDDPSVPRKIRQSLQMAYGHLNEAREQYSVMSVPDTGAIPPYKYYTDTNIPGGAQQAEALSIQSLRQAMTEKYGSSWRRNDALWLLFKAESEFIDKRRRWLARGKDLADLRSRISARMHSKLEQYNQGRYGVHDSPSERYNPSYYIEDNYYDDEY